MKKVISIGEALIDFIPKEKGVALKAVQNFFRVPGGAPLNVAASVSKLGGKSQILTKLGIDAFGDSILEEVEPLGVDISKVKRTNKANTALAFVSLKEDGERDFSFYRNPSADMLLDKEEIEENDFKEGSILHFCSVSLIDAPIKEAHRKAIEFAKKNNCLISFDPNVRLPLWENPEDCRKAIIEFLPCANILKVSDEELEFITGLSDEEKAIKWLFRGNIEVIIYTKGTDGAEFITKDKKIFSPSFKVKAEDTTGAGDSFIGAFLYQVSKKDLSLKELIKLEDNEINDILTFCNGTAALTVSKQGAIGALPTKDEVEKLISKR
ncbi:carbohydrate kinase family protein [Clostridium chauvoei]|uniref:Carbohydrate kinase n=2 Tax=Clostridium chauvoei TaxID=46867 RepID=A0ABD4RJ80_9CLOT|nr:carbohydrate kinase [Clostridium chauvoei]ATD55532.1 carbohydrate kinase [Clostridium chauvoei]ATD56792.1 carbohydrate kinase [Clostridium chauvoei]MBX7281220.1 carbohydrate kinase [Clostridium chauvoei]MBX7283702.1 carbohydrate kinase [Clostridium chauvoei]MBX7286310.1 carbohydrate kinase [Clostridium chauvoei]